MKLINNANNYSYFKISDAADALAKCYAPSGKQMFIVPASLDKDTLLDVISGFGSYFGKRPKVCTLGELYELICDRAGLARKRIVDPPDHKLIITYLLNRFMENPDINDALPGVKHKGLVSILGDNIRKLISENVSPSLLREKVLDESEELQPERILCDIYASYLKYLDENGLTDNAQIPMLIHAAMKNGKVLDEIIKKYEFIVVGFLSFTGSQLKLFRTLREFTQCSFFIPRTGMTEFRSAVKQLSLQPYIIEDIPGDPLKLSRIRANNHALELTAIARELALWRAEKGDFHALYGELADYGQVGIQISENRIPALLSELKRYKIPYNVHLRGTVAETALGKLPHLIWSAYASGWETDKTVLMLSDVLLSRGSSDKREFIDNFVRGKNSWLEKLEDKEKEFFLAAEKLCEELSNEHTQPEILMLWRDFVKSADPVEYAAQLVSDDIELDFAVKDLSAAVNQLDAKISVLNDLTKSIGPAASVKFRGADSVAFLAQWSETATLPIQLPQSGSVTVYGNFPSTFVQHDLWIMTDTDNATWPGKLTDSPLLRSKQLDMLNYNDEKTIETAPELPHLPTIKEQREQKEAVFRRLTATGRLGTILTLSMTDSKNRPNPESHFIERLSDDKAHWEFRDVGENKTCDYTLSRMLPRENDAWFPEAELPEPVKKDKEARDPFPRYGITENNAENAKLTVSISEIDDFAKCPYLWWCRKKLRLEPWKESETDILSEGTLLHSVWEKYWTAKDRPNSIYDFTVQNFDSLLDNLKNVRGCEKFAKDIKTDRMKRFLKKLRNYAMNMAKFQDKIESNISRFGRQRVDVEYQLQPLTIDGVTFKGRADRLDRYGENSVVILDYKLGKSGSHKDELQLAAYALLLKEAEGIETVGWEWLGHSDTTASGVFDDAEFYKAYTCKTRQSRRSSSDSGLSPTQEKINEAKAVMTEMAHILKAGKFDANYDLPGSKNEACGNCLYSSLCRLKEAPLYVETDSEDDTE